VTNEKICSVSRHGFKMMPRDLATKSEGLLIVKGKRISCPPHYAPPNNDYDPPHHDYEQGFVLIRSLRASIRRSTSVLFSFVLSLLIVAGSFAVRQSKTILTPILSAGARYYCIHFKKSESLPVQAK
jgi:hypothetical protein